MTGRLVAATTQGGLDDQVSSVFGRAPTFTVVEVEDDEIRRASAIPNPHKEASSGAGIQAAQLVVRQTPRAVLAGNFGPNVSGVMSEAGVELVPVSGMTVREAVAAYLSGKLSPNASVAPGPGFGPGMGPGMGRGMGRGLGRGGGMGRAAGMGGGIGRGMWDFGPIGFPPQTGPAQPEDPVALKERIAKLEAELADVNRKLGEIRGGE